MITLDSSTQEVLAEMEKLRTLYVLKQTLRYRTKRDPAYFSESVGEHIFGMRVIVEYFLPLEDPTGKLNRERIHQLILFHELGEIETGDIIFHRKTDADREEEQRAAERVAARLPESLVSLARERLHEFDDKKTPEAIFVNAIDKVEPIFEMYDESVLPMFKLNGINHETAVKNKQKVTERFPYMRKFLDAWEERAVSLDIFPQ